MSDKLVFDLAQEVEGSPSVFVRKDWLNILDNQNQNYNNNQSIIDTSQLSNSNKYMSYREAYLSIPFLVTLANGLQTYEVVNATTALAPFTPNNPASSVDYAVGLKNWFGQIIHSFTLDYNGTTIVQQTPYINMWNSFKLMTSLSLDDINTQGATIGFYPDDATSWQFVPPIPVTVQTATGPPVVNTLTNVSGLQGQGVCNNTNHFTVVPVAGAFNNFNSGRGNDGYINRQQFINYDSEGIINNYALPTGITLVAGTTVPSTTYASIVADTNVKQIWKSYISSKFNQTTATSIGYIQYSIVATVYLKHIHSFFNMCPLLKGVFMKMTMNLNNTTTSFTASSAAETLASTTLQPRSIICTAVANPLGGVNPLMLASGAASNGSVKLFPERTIAAATAGALINSNYKMNISVGSVCLDNSMGVTNSGLVSKSVYLYIPAYTFNPVFEQAYLSSPVKQIKYTDVYQYQVLSVGAGQNFNNLLTNGIANVKSVLILPFYSANPSSSSTTALTVPFLSAAGGVNTIPSSLATINNNTGFLNGTPVWQSPFDPAGTGPTSPLCWLTNFNIQVSGQNAIYNTQRYNFEQFNNQLYGQNAVNGGLTDGITSGLIDRQKFDMAYSYYYVNVERMLPVEMSVPKSIQILGTNLSTRSLDLYCFIEYGVEVSIDALTGARV
jgi:hypothetical protein